MSPNRLARTTDATTNENFFLRNVDLPLTPIAVPLYDGGFLHLLWYTQYCQEFIPRVCPGAGASGVPTPWLRTTFRPERSVLGGPASTTQFSTVPSSFLTSTSPVITTLVLLLFLLSPRRGQGEL